MATSTYGALGQAAPGAGVLTDLYAPAPGRHASVRVVCCNRGTATTVRVSLAPQGSADAVSQYIVFDAPVADYATQSTAPITAGGYDMVRATSASGNVSVTVTGVESAD